MSDIVERLRDPKLWDMPFTQAGIRQDAANMIESLRAALIDEWRRGQWGDQAIDEKLMALGLQPEPASV